MSYHLPKNTMTRTLEDGTIALDADNGHYILWINQLIKHNRTG